MSVRTPEAKVKAMIRRVLEEKGFARVGTGNVTSPRFYFMPIGGAYTAHGVADFILCDSGHMGAIEAKAKGGRQTELQKDFQQMCEAANAEYAVVTEEAELRGFLDYFLEPSRG